MCICGRSVRNARAKQSNCSRESDIRLANERSGHGLVLKRSFIPCRNHPLSVIAPCLRRVILHGDHFPCTDCNICLVAGVIHGDSGCLVEHSSIRNSVIWVGRCFEALLPPFGISLIHSNVCFVRGHVMSLDTSPGENMILDMMSTISSLRGNSSLRLEYVAEYRVYT